MTVIRPGHTKSTPGQVKKKPSPLWWLPKAALADLTSLGSLEHTFEPQATRMGGFPIAMVPQ